MGFFLIVSLRLTLTFRDQICTFLIQCVYFLARDTLNNASVAAVLGPYIDVFTSMAYVITKQAHLLTEKSESSEASLRSLPILPDSDSLADAVAEIIANMMKWEGIAFLSQSE